MPQTASHQISSTTMPIARSANEIEAYFKNYRLEVLASFERMVAQYCKSEVIYEDLASVLEDIGQDFCYLSDQINQEIKRRRSS